MSFNQSHTIKIIILFFALISFLVPFYLYSNYVAHHIFTHGSGVHDVGWFSYMLSNSLSFPVENPPFKGGTYFKTHFSPIFILTSFIHEYFFPFINQHIYFSWFMGFCNGLISLAVFIIGFQLLENKKSLLKILTISILSILTALNAQSLSLIGFPHFEIAIPALILTTFAFYLTGYKKSSYITIALLLAIREDSGFHLFAILATTIVLLILLKRSFKIIPKELYLICLISIIYSLISIYLQHSQFGAGGTFKGIYSGSPPYAHVNEEFISEKIDFISDNRAYLFWPTISLTILAIIFRNVLLIAPIIAITPWVILSFFAISPMPSSFSNYYAFPFILLLCWPLISLSLYTKFIKFKPVQIYKMIILTLLIPCLSTYLFYSNAYGNADDKPWEKLILNKNSNINTTQNVVEMINSNKQNLGQVLFDEAVSALSINTLKKDEYAFVNQYSKSQLETVETLIINEKIAQSKSLLYTLFLEDKLPNYYKIQNSNIGIASKFNLDHRLLIPNNNLTLTWNGKELPVTIKDTTDEPNKFNLNSNKGYLSYGPFIRLPVGKYHFEIVYSSNEIENKFIGIWDIMSLYPQRIGVGDIFGSGGKDKVIKGFFSIHSENNNVEIRTYHESLEKFELKNINIFPQK